MKDGILQYLIDMASRQGSKQDSLEGISRFVADYPEEALQNLEEDSIRVNGVTNRTRRLVTEAYEVGSEVHRRNVLMIRDYHEQLTKKWSRASLLVGAILGSVLFVLGFVAGLSVAKPERLPETANGQSSAVAIPTKNLDRARKDQLERLRLEGKLK